MKDEKALQRVVLAWLQKYAKPGKWENRSPSPFGAAGVPDICGVYRGRAIYIELKNPNDRHPPGESDKRWPAQRRFLREAFEAGAVCLATNNLAAVQTFIENLPSFTSGARGVFYEVFE